MGVVNNFLPLCLLEVIVKGEEIKLTITLNKSTGFSGFKYTNQLYNKGPVISRQFNVEMLHLRTFKLKYLKGSENCFYQHLKISNFCVWSGCGSIEKKRKRKSGIFLCTNQNLATFKSKCDDSLRVVCSRCQSNLIKPHPNSPDEADQLSYWMFNLWRFLFF